VNTIVYLTIVICKLGRWEDTTSDV